MGHSVCGSSLKLAQCGVRAAGVGAALSGSCATNWRPVENSGLCLRLDRPDYIAMTSSGLKMLEKTNRRSELSSSGVHVFSMSPQKPPNLLQYSIGLHHFDEHLPRTQMDTS